MTMTSIYRNRITYAMLLFVLLNVADITLTIIGLGLPTVVETNPFLQNFNSGIGAWDVFLKVGVATAAATYVIFSYPVAREDRDLRLLYQLAVAAAVTSITGVVVNNIVILVHASGV